MLDFSGLISASVKVVKDFIAFLYKNARTVYQKFKRWLWQIQGKFNAHDAFAEVCYGFMDDVEEFEWELQVNYAKAQYELRLAEDAFNRVITKAAPGKSLPQLCAPLGAFRSVDDYQEAVHEAVSDVVEVPLETLLGHTVVLYGSEDDEEDVTLPIPFFDRYRPGMVVGRSFQLNGSSPYVLPAEPVQTHCWLSNETLTNPARTQYACALIKAKEVLNATVQSIEHRYAEEKGEEPFGKWFNTLPQRMAYVKKAKARQAKVKTRARALTAEVERYDAVPDFHAITRLEQIPTGEVIPPKKDAEGKEVGQPIIKTKNVRRIIPGFENAAAGFIRKHIRCNNMRLIDASEVSQATVNRYALKFCEDMEMDMAGTEHLIKASLTMVPLPEKFDLTRAMIINCPSAREAREQIAMVNAPDF